MSNGTFITFYSYKGGVGRSLALANVATLLAGWGHRVLCVDWDLEAPGLQLYFRAGLEDGGRRTTPGLVDLIRAHQQELRPAWPRFVTPVRLSGLSGTLDLLHAGQEDAGYVKRMQALVWEQLYLEHDLGAFLETFRQEAAREYDFVLVDSRTGVADTVGICTVQLPDYLVFLFSSNDQSFAGALRVLSLVLAQRNRLTYDRARLFTVPVVTRWEGQQEYQLGQQWLRRFEAELPPWLGGWLPEGVSPRELLLHMLIPSIPYWSFGEQLPVREKGTADPRDLGYAFETLAALLAQKLLGVEALVRGRRDELLAGVWKQPAPGGGSTPGRSRAVTPTGLELLERELAAQCDPLGLPSPEAEQLLTTTLRGRFRARFGPTWEEEWRTFVADPADQRGDEAVRLTPSAQEPGGWAVRSLGAEAFRRRSRVAHRATGALERHGSHTRSR